MNKKGFQAVMKNKIWRNAIFAFSLVTSLSVTAAETAKSTDSYVNMKDVIPYFHPANSQEANLILLMNLLNQGQFFDGAELVIEDIETYRLTSKKMNSNDSSISKTIPSTDEQGKQIESKPSIPAPLFYLPSDYKDEQEKINNKILTELQQFGVEASARTISSLNELKRFNQTVVQDTLLDNLQKQLLISLRGALFSYHFATDNTDKTTLTTNDIITNKIKALSGDERVGEYKGYLLALDAYKNNQLDKAKEQFTVLIEAKHVWIAESAKYMLIRIAADEYTQWCIDNQLSSSEASVEAKTENVAKSAADKQSISEVLLEQKAKKIQEVERLVNAYQKRYPTGMYLMEVKLKLFEILNTQTDPLKRIRMYQMESAYYEELMMNPIDYEDALKIAPEIATGVLSHFPFALKNPIEKLTKEKAYLVQPIYPLLDFIDALALLDSNKKSEMNKKQIEKRIETVAFNLENISQNSLANYLRVEANWRLNKDANKTLEQIDALSLSFNDINKTDVFSIFLIKTEALLKLNKVDEANQIGEFMLKKATPNQPLSALKQVYLELKFMKTLN
ncbi:hypothetical protein [Thorsellia kenyensis]|uniref:Uncharacterized protein n=1 Tax=Thorsellia kenyensis TaxID=1549888 RepID=A0ABV6C6Q9_9GAMM